MKILASDVVKKHGTNDPFDIANQNHILIIEEALGNVRGYYNVVNGQQFIHVDDSLPRYFRNYVVAHLLYRVFTNSDEMMFLKRKETTRFTDSEREANQFANALLVPGTPEEFFAQLSEDDEEDLFQRLYRVWNPEHSMTKEELYQYILSQLQ